MQLTTLRSTRLRFVAGLLAAAVAACTAPAGREPTSPARTPSVATVPPTAGSAVGEAPEGVIAAVRADLAERIGSDALTSSRVVRSEAATWPDGSLGCPEPGMTYLALETPGYWIVLEVEGRDYDYRVPARGTPQLCEHRLPAKPGG